MIKRIKSTLSEINFSDFIPQAFQMIQVMKDTLPFVKKNRLWMGFFEHKWIAFFTAIVSILFSWYVFSDIGDYFFSESIESNIAQAGFIDGVDMEEVKGKVKEGGKDALFSGGTKYLLLIFLEVIIFYFSVRTLSILTNKNNVPVFNDFVRAEKRMMKLMAFNFVKGIVAQVFIFIALTIIGMNDYTSSLMFFVYAYFIGYAFLDNYNEQFGYTMKQSQEIVRQHVGAATALGLTTTLLLYIPLVGPLLAPILGGVAASIYGNRFSIEGAKSVEETKTGL